VLATPAAAQTALPTDPSVESAPGAVYQLPLDSARGDAAPGATVRSGGSKQIPGTRKRSSAIRSENGFGSSSSVPGAPTPAPRSPAKNGTSSPATPSAPPAARVITADSVSGGSSALGAYVLLTLALVAALGMATVVRRVTAR
jgi:hypothetical protein